MTRFRVASVCAALIAVTNGLGEQGMKNVLKDLDLGRSGHGRGQGRARSGGIQDSHEHSERVNGQRSFLILKTPNPSEMTD